MPSQNYPRRHQTYRYLPSSVEQSGEWLKQENSEWTSTWLECERKSHCRGLPGEELFEMGLKQWGFKIGKCRSKQPEHVCWGVIDITEVQPNRPDSGNDSELEPNTACNGQQKSIWNVRHFSQVRSHSYQPREDWEFGDDGVECTEVLRCETAQNPSFSLQHSSVS